MTECPNFKINLKDCMCTYTACEKVENAVNVYVIIVKEASYPAAYFHLKQKEPKTGLLERKFVEVFRG